jgi:glycosyltransferase involved in cell wall biosynthesis
MIWQTLRGILWADCVHVSIARDLLPIFASVTTLIFRRQLILQPHGMVKLTSGRFARIADPVLRRLFARAVVVICLTQTEVADIRAWGYQGPMRIMGNPVPDNLVLCEVPFPEDREVLFMARMHRRKRPDVFIRAAAKAHELGDASKWTLLGPDGGELSAALELLQARPGATYGGVVAPNDVYERVAESRLFVLTSADEPWGNVLVAALALGRPVVVTESTALAPLIREYGAGVVIEDDDPEALALAVVSMFTDEARLMATGANARTLARERLVDSVLRQELVGLYGEVADAT